MNTYVVDVQASTGYEFKNQTFSITVAADGFDSAARRAVRRAVERAEEWNDENPDAVTPRLTGRDDYRAASVRHVDVDAPQLSAKTVPAQENPLLKGATLTLTMDLDTVLATLNAKNS